MKLHPRLAPIKAAVFPLVKKDGMPEKSHELEAELRKHGINVIHGGVNALRYTPAFDITSAEIDLIIDVTRDALLNGPRKHVVPEGTTSEAA